jgi:DNA polymerase sigma
MDFFYFYGHMFNYFFVGIDAQNNKYIEKHSKHNLKMYGVGLET